MEKLRKRIFYSIFLLCLVFAVTVSGVSYVVIVSNLHRNQIAKSNSNCSSAAKMTSTYISQVMRFVETTASSRTVALVASGNDLDASGALDRLCNYSIKIDGATIYGYDGHMTYSANMGAPPTLDELKNEPGVFAFLTGKERTHISVRVNHVAGVYNKTHYNSANGVISCMSKIYKDGKPCGVLVADILPETLFSQRMLYSSFGSPCKFVVAGGGNVLTADEELKALVSGESSVGGSYYIVSQALTKDASLRMYVAKDGFAHQCVTIALAMLAFLAVLVWGVARVARAISRNAVAPLEKLNGQMNLTNLPDIST